MEKRIVELVNDIQKSPLAGKGNPEPFKHELKGYWSQRINDEHKLVYKFTDEKIILMTYRYHY